MFLHNKCCRLVAVCFCVCFGTQQPIRMKNHCQHFYQFYWVGTYDRFRVQNITWMNIDEIFARQRKRIWTTNDQYRLPKSRCLPNTVLRVKTIFCCAYWRYCMTILNHYPKIFQNPGLIVKLTDHPFIITANVSKYWLIHNPKGLVIQALI